MLIMLQLNEWFLVNNIVILNRKRISFSNLSPEQIKYLSLELVSDMGGFVPDISRSQGQNQIDIPTVTYTAYTEQNTTYLMTWCSIHDFLITYIPRQTLIRLLWPSPVGGLATAYMVRQTDRQAVTYATPTQYLPNPLQPSSSNAAWPTYPAHNIIYSHSPLPDLPLLNVLCWLIH